MKNYFKVGFGALCGLMLVSGFTSCSDDSNDTVETPLAVTGLYVLDAGSYGGNNAALTYVDDAGKITDNIFIEKNNVDYLGDMGNHMIKYGSKLYIALYGSKTVEIVDASDATSLAQLKLKDDNGNERGPRMFAAYGSKVYLTTYDGYVARIDTASLQVEAYAKVGPNPEGIAIANGKIYTADTDGLNWPSNSTSVSVVDINTFEKEKTITVNKNPNYIYADSDGDVYVICLSDYSDDLAYSVQRIDAKSNAVTTISDIKAYKMTVYNDIAYIAFNDYYAGNVSFYKYDLKNEKLLSSNFITDGTTIKSPNGVGIDPVTEDIYVAQSNKTNNGDVFVFSKDGVLKSQFETPPYPADFAFMLNK